MSANARILNELRINFTIKKKAFLVNGFIYSDSKGSKSKSDLKLVNKKLILHNKTTKYVNYVSMVTT